MTYYSDTLTIQNLSENDGEMRIRTTTARSDVVVQLYVGGSLADWQSPDEGEVEFAFARPADDEPMMFLVVDADDADTDYWDDAFDTAATYGNRIQVDFTLQLSDGYKPGDKWRIYRGDAGDAEATIQLYEAPIFPGGRHALGWGFDWGNGGWGYSASNAPGWGRHWGHLWGIGIDYLRYITPPLTRGTYPIKVEVEDRAGNVSTETTDSVEVDTFPRPASGLAVSSYTQGTDTLVLTQTASPDI